MTCEKPMQVLLVEDDPSHAELARLAFEDSWLHFTLHHVSDGEKCVTYLQELTSHPDTRLPDVILLDLKMPILSGHEVLAALNKDSLLRDIPVIVLTTSGNDTDKARAYDENALGYVVKPIDAETVHQIVRDLREYYADR